MDSIAHQQSDKMVKVRLNSIGFIGVILLLFSSIGLFAQVGKVGIRDSFSVDPSKIVSDEILKNEIKLNSQHDLYKSQQSLSQPDVMSGSDDQGNTQSSQYQKRKIMIDAAAAGENIMYQSELTSGQYRQDLDSLDIFGYQYFRDKKVKLYSSATDVKAPKNYVIGSGDQIQVVIYGYSDYNELFVVDRDGYIQPRYTGKIFVKGITLEAAEKLIKQKIGQNYYMGNSKVEVTLNYSRVITTHVVGEVENPGSYTFPAINTAYNLLSHIGGPSKIGSLRNVQIKRAGKVLEVFDLYNYLFNQEKAGDIFLENNDYLYVPLANNVVTINGAIVRPGKYEMMPGETVSDLLKFSAGFLPDGFKGSLQVKRFLDDKMVVVDVTQDKYSTFTLERGDVISVQRVTQEPRNYVKIHGPVYVPGIYQATPGMKLMDVIGKAQGLLPEVYINEAYILRVNEDFTRSTIKVNLGNAIKNNLSADNAEIKERDEVVIFSQNQFYDKFGVSISGGVRSPQSYPMLFGMSLRDLIIMSGGLKVNAVLDKAVIYRTSPNLEEEAIYVSLDTTNQMAALDTIFLKQKDKVRVFEKTSHLDELTITVHGAVRNPGVQTFRRNMTLSEALLASGDIKMNAAANKIEVSRMITLDSNNRFGNNPVTITVAEIQVTGSVSSDDKTNGFILQPYDEIFVREIPNFRSQQIITLSGEVIYPGVYSLTSKDEKITSVIERAGGLTSYAFARGASMYRKNDPDKGLVVMNLDEAMRRKKSRYNYILRGGDSIYIPVALDFVTIKGAVEHPDVKRYGAVNVPFSEKRSAKYYINNFGAGFSERAVKKKTVVSNPNGEAHKVDFVLFGRKYPKVDRGSEIYVPEKNYLTKKEKKRQRSDREKVDRDKIVQTTVGSLTSILTMALLIVTTVK